ncbi:MAG: hypothetical protein Tsb002_22080 [Wenzhouxiangellaceae bacterium]
MNKKTYRLGILGVEGSDALVLRSIIRLIDNQLDAKWVFDEYEHADVIIALPDHPRLPALLEKRKHLGRPLCVSLLDGISKAAEGTPALKTPVRVRDLVDLLERYAAEPPADRTADEAAANSEKKLPRGDSQRSKNALALARKLQRESAAAERHDLVLTVNGQPQIAVRMPDSMFRILGKEPVVASDGAQLLERLEGLRQEIGVEKVTDSGPQNAANWMPLDCLYWHFGVQILSDSLLPGLNDKMRFKIKRWPDFGSIGSEPGQLRLAAFMTRRAMTIEQLTAVSQQTRNRIIAFINACALCNLLIPVDAKGQVENTSFDRLDALKTDHGGLSNVFGAIRSVFRLRG